MTADALQNFGANVVFSPQLRYEPRNSAEVLDILDRERGKSIRVGGRLHSWSPVAATDDVYLDLRQLNEISLAHDEQGPVATVGAGCQIKRLLRELDAHGLTLPTVGLISEQTIAGAISTATHGSGRHVLSHYVSAVHLAHYDPASQTAKLSEIRGGDELRAAQCSLGCLGVIVAVELRLRAAYRIEEHLSMHRSLESVLAAEGNTPLQQFFYLPWYDRYLGQHRRETDAPRSWLASLYRSYWFLVVDVGLHVVLQFLVQQLRSTIAIKNFFRYLAPLTILRGWQVVDRSQDMLIMEHELFRHIEIELFVTRTHLPAALDLSRQLISHFDHGQGLPPETRRQLEELGLAEQLSQAPGTYTHHYVVCVRRVLADATLLSMASGGAEDYYAISFISYAWPDQRQGFLQFAEVLARSMAQLFAARSHWGKICPHNADDVETLYPQLERFRSVCRQYDPEQRFANPWVRELLLNG